MPGKVIGNLELLAGQANGSGSRALEHHLEHLARIYFEGYTPYMGGDFAGNHYAAIAGSSTSEPVEDTNSWYITGYPSAKSLIGRMRWFARVIVAQAACLSSHIEAETSERTVIAPLDTSGKDKVKLGIVPLLFGATPALYPSLSASRTGSAAWKGLLTIQVEPAGKLRIEGDKYTFIDVDYVELGKLVRFKKGKRFKKSLDLFPTRFMLNTLGLTKDLHGNKLVLFKKVKLDKEELYFASFIEPLKGLRVSFFASLLFDSRRLRSVLPQLNGDTEDLLKAFSVELLIATPFILGLGKGVNRGFGRFAPRNLDCASLTSKFKGSKAKSLLESFCKGLDNVLNDGNSEMERKEGLILLIESLIETVSSLISEPKPECGICSGQLSLIPRVLGVNSHDFVKVVRGYWADSWIEAYSRRLQGALSPINRAIAAINYASLKSSWKRLLFRAEIGKKPEERPGLDLHTWVLGLPRSQKFPDQRVQLKTGYIIIENAPSDVFTAEAPGCNYEGFDECSDKRINWSRLKTKGGRRQSMIIAFPLPARSPSESSRITSPAIDVALMLMPSADFMEILEEASKAKEALYHAGPHNVKNRNKPCAEPVINVAHSLSKGNNERLCGKTAGAYFYEDSARSEGNRGLDPKNCSDYLKLLVDHAFKIYTNVITSLSKRER